MSKRLRLLLLVATVFIVSAPSSIEGQQDEFTASILKGISAVSVQVDKLPDSVKALGLTEKIIQTDVELQLRLAGMRIATDAEWLRLPGRPLVYVHIEAAPRAVHVEVGLSQDTRLERNGAVMPNAKTWAATVLASGDVPSQGVRDLTKDELELFLNAWLSVNPKK